MQLAADDWIDRGERLIHQQDQRVRREGPRHTHPLLLPT